MSIFTFFSVNPGSCYISYIEGFFCISFLFYPLFYFSHLCFSFLKYFKYCWQYSPRYKASTADCLDEVSTQEKQRLLQCQPASTGIQLQWGQNQTFRATTPHFRWASLYGQPLQGSLPLYFRPFLVLFPSILWHYPFWSLSTTCNSFIGDTLL